MKDCAKGRGLTKGQHTATRISLMSLLLLTTMMIAVVITTNMQTTQSTPEQNTNRGNPIRELSPPTGSWWAKAYGGSNHDDAYSVQQTADGGYIVAGWTESFGAGSSDFWVLKLDSSGGVTWQKTYGGSAYDYAYSVQQTADLGYVVAGYTNSFGAGSYDAWVLKLNSTGGVTWQKTYGGSAYDYVYSVQQTSDGGYIVAGSTNSFGAGFHDVWVLKLDSFGEVTWQKTYGGSTDEWASSVQQTADLGYVVAGTTYSFGAGYYDVWVLKLNSSGSIDWQKTYGDSYDDELSSVQQTGDGGYIVAAHTYSFGVGIGDFWVLKLNSTGSIDWQKTYGGSTDDCASSVQQTADGGYIVAGTVTSFGAGGCDFWVLKLDSTGSVVWDAGSGASTQTTSVTPLDSGVEASPTSATTGVSGAGTADTAVLPGIPSVTVTVQSTPDTTPPATIKDVTASSSTSGSITMTWTAPGDDGTLGTATGYVVKYSTTGPITDLNWASAETYPQSWTPLSAGNEESHDVSGLMPDATYWFAVEAYDKVPNYGGVSNSPAAVATVLPPYWAKTYGGGGNDVAESVRQTYDGGYIVAGYTGSFGAGYYDVWVLRLNSTGGVMWQKTYGSGGGDKAYSVQQTADGGYIVAGATTSFGAGSWDFWVLKLDSTGGVEWQKTYGGTDYDEAHSVQQTADGGYIVAGSTISFSPEWSFWVLKLDSTGGVTWQKIYANGDAYSVQQTADGGYIVAGYTYLGYTRGDDAWVLKLDSTGEITWQNTYGDPSSSGNDYAYSVQQTSDGGYIVAGCTISFSPEWSFWVLKLDSTGGVTWQKIYAGGDYAYSVQQTSDGGYIVAGRTWTFGAGYLDVWVLKLDSSGGVEWQKTYGGSTDEWASSVQQTYDGGYMVAGTTYSFGSGGDDVWVVKLGVSGDIVFDSGSGASTQTTSVTPSDSSAAVTATSATPATSTAAVEDTNVTPYDTDATVTVQSPPPAPTIDQPSNVAYTVGVTGISITWHPSSQIPSKYSITRNGTIVASETWSGTPISQSVDGLSVGRYNYTCTVNDTVGRTASSSVEVLVVPLPTIDQPSAITYVAGTTGHNITWHPSSQLPYYYTISVNGSPPDFYGWDGQAITLSVDGLSAGTYNYNCTVYDTFSRKASSIVQVTVLPLAPTIDQLSDVTYIVGQTGNSITWHPLSAIPDHYTISVDGGSPSSYSWDGSAITLSVDGLSVGTYTYNCTVYDALGRTASSKVQVTVLHPAPTIDQPSSITYIIGHTGNNITWTPSSEIPSWYCITRNGTIVASGSWNGSSITRSIDGLSLGTYIYMCSVNDTLGRTASSSVQVIVVLPSAPTIDQPPAITYVAGTTGHTITWHPSSEIPDHYTISVNGSSPTSHSWNGSAITYNADGFSAGTYIVNCTVYDTQGRSISSTVTVTVSAPPGEGIPVIIIVGGLAVAAIVVVISVVIVMKRKK